MSLIHAAIDSATTQQDYAWFCGLLVWAAAACLVVTHWTQLLAHRAVLSWLIATVAAGVILCCAELVMHAWPPHPYTAERVGWDRLLSGTILLQGLALLPLFFNRVRRTFRVGIALLALCLIGLWLCRSVSPLIANGVIAAVLFGLAWALYKEGRLSTLTELRGPWLGRALLLIGPAHFASTTGLWSELSHQQRRWTELSLLGLPSAALQCLIALCVIAAFDPRKHLHAAGRFPAAEGSRREVRNHAWALGFWLLFGLVIAWLTGRAGRAAFEESLLARARAASALVGPENVRRILGPRFKLQALPDMHQPSGRSNAIALVPVLPELEQPTADELARVERVNPGIYWAHLVSLRDGQLVSSVFSSKITLQRDAVSLLRPVSAEDWQQWCAREPWFEAPILGAWGELVRAYAPVIHPEAGMLGWIALDFGISEWTAAQALARLQSFALVGAGACVLLLLLVRRLRMLEHLHVRERAAVALASDRAKTAFLAKVSHELRTPVQSILGYGELLAGLTLPAEPNRWLGAIRTQGQLLIRLVNDLLDLSAMQAGAFRLAPRPTRIASLVVSCTDSLQPRAMARGLSLECTADPATPPWLNLDPERVRQILFNLLGNAIKFTAEGSVKVQLVFSGFADESVNPRVAQIAIVVTDTGPGIPVDQQAKLFHPFSRLHAQADLEGAGLGLSLTAALCTSMGGTLKVSSDGTHGSTFTATLLLTEASAPSPDTGTVAGFTALASRKILIADDNSLVRELYTTGLRSAGAWCETAADGLEAVERCVNESFDTVVLDVSMPWLDGIETTRRLRQLGQRGLKIIGVSAHAGTSEREVGLAAGMDVFLVKPVALAELIAAVAGTAATSTLPATDAAAELALLRRLRAQFVAEAPRLMAELTQAAGAGDRQWLIARAHHLKNSADVTGYPELGLLCSRVMQLGEKHGNGTRAELSRLVSEINLLLARLCADTPLLSPGTPEG